MRLAGKRILLGVTGSISAYKSAELCRLLKKEGAEVQVVMTTAATSFITPLTLSTLSGKETLLHMISGIQTWNNHVELGLWAELMLVAPASANTISAFATGKCDNLLQAVFLSARCPVMIAPAMDHDMYLNESTTFNLKQLAARKVSQLGPDHGELASGLTGEGRLLEPASILTEVVNFFGKKELPFAGIKALVTAGPTREAIDPVRYISNHSTGKMGVAIAETLAEAGAEVHLVAGPLQVDVPAYIHLIKVTTADEMKAACDNLFHECKISILTAAVADFKVSTVSAEKIKKASAGLQISLEHTPDILSGLGKVKRDDQVLVGFALETNDEFENARKKLENKNLDLIVLNSLNDTGAGFGHDTNKVTFMDRKGEVESFPLMTKKAVATAIINKIQKIIHA